MGVLASVALFFALISLSECYEDKTVYQYLVDNSEYSGFVQLLKDTKEDQILTGTGPFTIFAPSNNAIARMDPGTIGALRATPWQFREFVKYHVSKNFLLIQNVHGYTTIMTAAGQRLEIVHLGDSLIINNVSRVDSPPNNDIICNNGIIQPIDHALIPPLYSNDNLFAALVYKDYLFQDFTMSLLLTNLSQVIQHGEYTVFAPTNDAYVKYVQAITKPSNLSIENQQRLSFEMYKYHVVPGARPLSVIKNHQLLYTLHGTPLNITILDSGILVNNALITHPDIPAANGVIHGMDDVLFPLDLLHELGIDPANVAPRKKRHGRRL